MSASTPAATASYGTVTGLSFGVVDSAQVVAQGVPVYERQMYHKNGKPRVGGLADAAMAPPNRSTLCATCKNPLDTCSGHTGQITLPITVYQVVYMKDILRMLQGVCCLCSNTLLQHDALHARVPPPPRGTHSAQYSRAALAECKKRGATCEHCGCPQPEKYALHRFVIRRVWSDRREDALRAFLGSTGAKDGTVAALLRDYNAGDAADTLSSVPDEAWDALRLPRGTGRYMCARHVSVLSPKESPTVQKAEGSKTYSQDDMRHAMASVLRHAHSVRDKLHRAASRYRDARAATRSGVQLSDAQWGQLGMPRGVVRDRTHALAMGVEHVSGDECAAVHVAAPKECSELQQAVAALYTMDALSDQERQRSKRAAQHIRERLVGKGGRMRGDINGVRVNHAARGVITASTQLDVHQVGVPARMARVLTVQQRVHARNVHLLRDAVALGAGELGGATHVDRSTLGAAGIETVHLRGLSEAARHRVAAALVDGDVVRRHLATGDWVLLNRQPTLHRASIMAMECVLVPGNSIKFRVTCTPPFNADFDGDEMNLHVLQTTASRAEAYALMAVACNLSSPQHNGVNIFPAQDEMLAMRELSKARVWVDLDVLRMAWETLTPSDALSRALRLPQQDPPGLPTPPSPQPWSRVVSGRAVLGALMPALTLQRSDVTVCDGVVTDGAFTRGSVVALLRASEMVMGAHATVAWLSNVTRVASLWLTRCAGASIGPRDIAVSDATLERARAGVAAVQRAVDAFCATPEGTATLGVSPAVRDARETAIVSALSTATDIGFRGVSDELSEARSVMMRAVTAKSKGSNMNATQLIVCLGQQIVGSARPGNAADGGMLPHFARDDASSAARGFVDASFRDGLRPVQFFYHMQAALLSLVSVAVSTADVGYLQRCLGQGLNGYVVQPSGAVGCHGGATLQLAYGGDGAEPQRLHRVAAKWAAPASDAALPTDAARRTMAALRHEHAQCTTSAAQVANGAAAPLDAVRVPFDTRMWVRGRMWSGHAGAGRDDSAGCVSKYEYAALLSRRMHALEQNAPGLSDAPAVGGGGAAVAAAYTRGAGETLRAAVKELASPVNTNMHVLTRHGQTQYNVAGPLRTHAAIW